MLESLPGALTPGTTGLFTDKTRDRILMTSLVLFNERGFGSVTTAAIAHEAGVLEGSLWYHFNTKKDLVAAHIETLQRLFLSENQHAHLNDAPTIVQGIFRSYDVIWDFRYILRDDFQAHLPPNDPVLERIKVINDVLDRWTEGRILHSQRNQLLNIRPDEIEQVSEITLVIGRYWLDFSRKKYPTSNDAALRKKGLEHVFKVLQPYLSSEATHLIHTHLDAS